MRRLLPFFLAALFVGTLAAQDVEPGIFYPRSAADVADATEEFTPGVSAAGSSTFVMFAGYGAILAILGVVVFFALKRGGWKSVMKRSEGRLQVTETRMLGNRQFIMVVEYEASRLLVGVSPGRIELLTPLGPSESELEALPEGLMAGAKGG